MATGVVSWSQTASANASADSAVNAAEGMAPSAVNDSMRGMMASTAKYRDDTAGSLTTGGSNTAYTLTSNQTFASLSAMSGQSVTFKVHATNGATPTLNVDSLGAKALHSVGGTAVPTGALIENGVYSATYDNSNSRWVLHDAPGTFSAISTSGNVTVGGTLGVTGAATFSAAVTVGTGLTVSAGGAAITGNSAVTGTFTVSSTLTASNGFTVSSGAVTLPAGALETQDYADSSVTDAKIAMPGSMKLIFAQSASDVGNIDFNASNSASAFDGTYDRLILIASCAKPATDDVEFWIRIGTGGGPTYQTSGYKWIATVIAPSDGTATQGSSSTSRITIGNTGVNGAIGNASGEAVNATIQFDQPNASNFMEVMYDATYHRADDQPCRVMGAGDFATVGAVTAIRLMFESGNIASGKFALYGIKKS